MRLGTAAALTTVALLALGHPALAHLTAEPGFVASGDRQTLAIASPNEREAAMSGLSVTVPPGLSIVEALPAGDGWDAKVEGREASWSGGALAAGATKTFPLVVEASGEPGEVTLEARQLYPGAAQVEWAVPVTILPGTESSDSRAPVLLVAGIAAVVVAGVLLLVLLRRRRSPARR